MISLECAAYADSTLQFIQQQPTGSETCKTIGFEQFNRDVNYNLFVGPEQSVKKFGFTHEVPLPRNLGTALWCILNPEVAEKNLVKLNPPNSCESVLETPLTAQSQQLLDYLKAQGSELNLKFSNEGEILELLARLTLGAEDGPYPTASFSITGGIQYLENGQTRGELDLVVFNNTSCQVVAVGEAKLCSDSSCPRAIKKAHNQIERFMTTLYPYLAARDPLLNEWATRTETLDPISPQALLFLLQGRSANK